MGVAIIVVLARGGLGGGGGVPHQKTAKTVWSTILISNFSDKFCTFVRVFLLPNQDNVFAGTLAKRNKFSDKISHYGLWPEAEDFSPLVREAGEALVGRLGLQQVQVADKRAGGRPGGQPVPHPPPPPKAEHQAQEEEDKNIDKKAHAGGHCRANYMIFMMQVNTGHWEAIVAPLPRQRGMYA
jgi:hypothetical protein